MRVEERCALVAIVASGFVSKYGNIDPAEVAAKASKVVNEIIVSQFTKQLDEIEAAYKRGAEVYPSAGDIAYATSVPAIIRDRALAIEEKRREQAFNGPVVTP